MLYIIRPFLHFSHILLYIYFYTYGSTQDIFIIPVGAIDRRKFGF